jgi:signal transduction histidine kinase
LAIVKATVEQHSGSIDVESEEGKGTTFRIFLNKGRQRLKS